MNEVHLRTGGRDEVPAAYGIFAALPKVFEKCFVRGVITLR